MGRTASGTVGWRGNPPRWWARVTALTPEGKKRRPWVDLERPDIPHTEEGRAVAKRLALKRAKLARKGRFVGVARAMAPRVTLADLQDRWFALLDTDVHLKAGTAAVYKSCWTTNGLPVFGKLLADELTVPVLRGWVRDLTAKLSPSSVRNNAIAMTRLLSDGRAEGWIDLPANPMKHEDVRAMLPTVEAPDPDALVRWTRPQVEQLLAVPTLPDDRFGLYLVAFLAGLRAGELRGLTFGSLSLDASVPLLRVREQLGLARAKGKKPAMGTPKSKSGKRDVPLHHAAASWLAWWQAEGWAAHTGRERTDESPIFPAVSGEAGRPRDPNILRRDLAAANLPEEFTTPEGVLVPYTFHATRRTFSRLLTDNGVPSEVVSMLDGHAPKGVTLAHYIGRSMEAMARAVASLRLTLPTRKGVVQSSRESSPKETGPLDVSREVPESLVILQEHPIELPQFRHL